MSCKNYLLAASVAALFLPATLSAQRKPSRTTRPAARAATTKPAAQDGAVRLTPEDMTLIVEGLNLPAEARARLMSDAAERKAFAKDIREMLALAEESKAAGLAARPDLALQLELSRAFVIAQAFFKKREAEGATTPEQVVPQAEIDALVKEPGQDKQFEAFVEDYRKNGPGKGAPVTDEQRAQLLQHWGRVMAGRRKGVAAGLHRARATELVVMLQQARLLAGAYAKELAPRFKATDAEVNAYLAGHPELDSKEARAKIDALLKRARAGEDFSALAREFSTDPGSKDSGGDLGWFGRGVMVKPFEDTAFSLKAGEVSEVFESPFGFHIVKLEERRAQDPAGGAGEQVRARHILIPFNSRPRRAGSPPQSPREEARTAVEEEKRARAFDEITARRRVVVPDDYRVELSVTAPVNTGPASGGGARTTGAQATTKPAAATKPKQPAPKRRPSRRP